MLLNKKDKHILSIKSQVMIVSFCTLFVLSSVLLILFHTIITVNSLNSIYIDNNSSDSNVSQINTKDIISNIQNQEGQDFRRSLIWVLIANALTDAVLAYAVSIWIADPIESLYVAINNAYKQGIAYKNNNNNKFTDIDGISYIVSQMTAKYVNALDEQNKFVQDISHELKTPLSAIKSSIDIIKLNPVPKIEEYKVLVDIVNLTNIKMIDLVNQLTLLNKSEDELYDDVKVNLSKIIEDVIQSQMEYLSSRNITVVSNIHEGIFICGSAKNLTIALSYILNNAIKYSKAKSEIKVNLYKEKENVYIIIKDSGMGISEGDIKNIFEKFYRGENAQEKEGFGLSLQISKKIINAHGGNILVNSQLGVGSKVKISL